MKVRNLRRETEAGKNLLRESGAREAICFFDRKRIVGVNDDEDPPVPIPNTVVKLVGAEDTWLETTRKNRTMPTYSLFIFRGAEEKRPVSQAVKTLASHAEDRSSILLRVTKQVKGNLFPLGDGVAFIVYFNYLC